MQRINFGLLPTQWSCLFCFLYVFASDRSTFDWPFQILRFHSFPWTGRSGHSSPGWDIIRPLLFPRTDFSTHHQIPPLLSWGVHNRNSLLLYQIKVSPSEHSQVQATLGCFRVKHMALFGFQPYLAFSVILRCLGSCLVLGFSLFMFAPRTHCI